ncbi:glutamyl-tRNA synthetase [Motilibacter rhizosphaerae]|uniref:Glutamate--tRNA ligase n=1 Tax=Motilibacter rhizosphaerae TaxID=598652 RepID=A0A4Q7NP42_9ACTN|nr:glutamate--tRNA ligase [Motilibacter rhizosphaerae]RZS87025.1 glutamyl-tRNA synthetase [Motilibacter rhizosphaerae]
MPDSPIRVRFCPSPTGNPHVGLVRTALFNWAWARHVGGTFVFRIEDTDAARDSEESYDALLDTLRWLGLDWDEGPEVGGPHAPYRQSQRMDLYADVARRLLEAGLAYESFSTPEEVEARRRAAGQDPKLGYDGADRGTSAEQAAAYRAEGRTPVLRLRMPDEDLVFDDLVRGEVRFAAGSVPDFVIVRGDGSPLYPLVNPVDDVLMGITHVLRGEDLLSSTPRQLALYRALGQIGVGSGEPPLFGHLPYVMGEGNKKLSKRDPQSAIGYYRDAGFIPEGLLNYLALLGWSIADDHDVFSLAEMVEAFDISRVNPNPARFDLKKCEAINAEWIRRLAPEDFAVRAARQLQLDGYVADPPTAEQQRLLDGATPLVQERVTLLAQVSAMTGFLFTDEVVVAEDARGQLDAAVLDAAASALEALGEWDTAAIEAALRAALVDGLGLKPKNAFGPVRVAVTGRRVSPPLFESMELLGRESSLSRLRAARASLG